METKEQETEFERRLFNILRTYNEYKIVQRKLRALAKDPDKYMLTGSLMVPTNNASQEHMSLNTARAGLWGSLQEQSQSLSEPLAGILPPRPMYDLTYTPKTIHEILEAVCGFVSAAVKLDFSSTADGDVHIYEEDVKRY